MKKNSRLFGKTYQKEASLLFLAFFYFVIATNTQTGWLFVLSAFLFGVLAISWTLSRRSHRYLRVEQKFTAEPQRGQVFRVTTLLTNIGHRAVQEAKLEFEHPEWAEAIDAPFHWAVPELSGQTVASVEQKLVPQQRGEHTLPPVTLVCGAPFGLFTQKQQSRLEKSFLVYPQIEKLPSKNSRSRLATSLGEVISSRGRGGTRNLRSVREYRSGDDLRQVHWKASAKLGCSNLLIKEHHAPSPAHSTFVLDTSSVGQVGLSPTFERAVTLASSLLWAAHRDGTRTSLVLLTAQGEWQKTNQWSQQYQALAKVQRDPNLNFQAWCERSLVYFQAGPTIRGSRIYLLKGAQDTQVVEEWPHWITTAYVFRESEQITDLQADSRIHILDATAQGFQEFLSV